MRLDKLKMGEGTPGGNPRISTAGSALQPCTKALYWLDTALANLSWRPLSLFFHPSRIMGLLDPEGSRPGPLPLP